MSRLSEHIDTPVVDHPVEIGFRRIRLTAAPLCLLPIGDERSLHNVLHPVGITQESRRIEAQRPIIKPEELVDIDIFQNKQDTISRQRCKITGNVASKGIYILTTNTKNSIFAERFVR